MINLFVGICFIVALGKRTWKLYKNSLIVSGINALLAPKQTTTLSKATRTISRTLLIEYQHNDNIYELIIPASRKSLKWTSAIAVMNTQKDPIDVTKDVKRKAGPYGDFFGINLKPTQIIRNASEIHLFNSKGTLVKKFK